MGSFMIDYAIETLRLQQREQAREAALKLNRERAIDSMHFTPYTGFCYSCGADIVEQYGLAAIAEGLNVTGCRKCHTSFCD